MRWFLSAICMCLVCNVALADPKEKPKKGNYKDQQALDLAAGLTNNTQTKADGNLNDWHDINGADFATLMSGEYEYDWTGPKDLSGTVKAQYSADKLFFLIQVKDNAVVAKKKQWKSDRIELWLEPETEDGKSMGTKRGIMMDVGPLVAGDNASIKWISGKGGGLEGAGYVGHDGYDFEIAVDFAALGKTSPVMKDSMRFCVLVRDWDQDDPNEDEAAIGSCPINPKKASSIKRDQMGKMRFRLDEAMWNLVLENDAHIKNIDTEWTKHQADMTATTLPEIIAFSGSTLVIAGYGLNGQDFSWIRLDLDTATTKPAQIETKDVDGDKKPEILLTRNEHCTNGAMNADRTYVFKFADGTVKLLANYIAELRYDGETAGSVKNNYKFTKTGIVQTMVKGAAADMQHCTLNGDAEMIPLLMPADTEKSRTIPYAP